MKYVTLEKFKPKIVSNEPLPAESIPKLFGLRFLYFPVGTLSSILSLIAGNLDVSLINQDPYPAIPGDYVKVVFQIDGIENPECGIIEFEVKEDFPISLDPRAENKIIINSGIYERKYSSFYVAPYQLRIDEDAIEGDNPIEISYTMFSTEILKEFNIYVEDARADFEIYVKDYNYNTEELTLEILNIENVDVEALTIEIPKQEIIQVKGANRVVVGDLDSNEYTTADFKSIIEDGEINVKIIYTDSTNTRRTLEKTITFDSEYFVGLTAKKKKPIWPYILIVLVIAWFVWRQMKKAKKKKMKHKQHSEHN